MLETVELLVDADLHGLTGLDTVALRKLSERSVNVQSWLAAFDTRIAAAAAGLTVAGRPVDPEPIVSGGGRRSRREAAATVERANACAAVPEIGAALAAGELGTAHIDAIAAVTRGMSDAAKERFGAHGGELVDNGRFETPEEFARRCKQLAGTVIDETERLARQERCRRQRKVTRWADADGMCHTKLSLDPLADAQLWAVIEAAFGVARSGDQSGDERSFDQLRADTVVELLTNSRPFPTASDVSGDGAGADSKAAGRVAVDRGAAVGWVGAEISVLIDLASLLGHPNATGTSTAGNDHANTADTSTAGGTAGDDAGGGAPRSGAVAVCETGDGQPLPVATVRRLCCDGRILPVVLNGHGLPVDVGRAQRLATRQQRQALRALYATCAHPQCGVGFERCRIHHVRFWEHHGPTDLANLIPLCERHHHLVHEGGWTLTLTPDRTTTWRSPDGRITHHGDSRNRHHAVEHHTTNTATRRPNPNNIHVDVDADVHVGAGAGAGATVAHRLPCPQDTPRTERHLDHAHHAHRDSARRMADEVTRRREAAAQAAASTTTATRRRPAASEPIPLFGTDDTLQRRGPPRAG